MVRRANTMVAAATSPTNPQHSAVTVLHVRLRGQRDGDLGDRAAGRVAGAQLRYGGTRDIEDRPSCSRWVRKTAASSAQSVSRAPAGSRNQAIAAARSPTTTGSTTPALRTSQAGAVSRVRGPPSIGVTAAELMSVILADGPGPRRIRGDPCVKEGGGWPAAPRADGLGERRGRPNLRVSGVGGQRSADRRRRQPNVVLVPPLASIP